MNKILTTPIGEFSAQIERISGKNVEAYLGVRYAKAEPFAVPELIDSYSEKPANAGYGIRFPQQDVPPLINRLLKMPVMRPEILTNTDRTSEDAFVLNVWTNGTEEKKPVLVFIHGGESFAVSEKIRINDGTGYEDQPFPQKEEIRAVYDGDLFERLQKDFMGRRNADFIA